MTKLEYIKERMSDKKLREDLLKVVPDVDALIPQSENEFSDIQKFGLYPADQCVPFVTKQGTPFYQLDNMSMVPKGDTANYLRYGDFVFRQIEILYNMARVDYAKDGGVEVGNGSRRTNSRGAPGTVSRSEGRTSGRN